MNTTAGAPKKTSSANQSTEKAFMILELLAAARTPMRLRDISTTLGMNSSTASRFLASLQQYGYVIQEPETQRYHLTYKICRIANQFSSHVSISSITHPYLEQLSSEVNESVCLSIEQNMSTVYVDIATKPNHTLLSLHAVGNTGPMHCTAIGKLLLLNYSEKQIDEFIRIKGLERHTEHTITTKEQLLEELDRIRDRGCAYDNEECEIGVRCVALPIRDYTGAIVAGISVTGPTTRMTQSAIDGYLPFLRKASNGISTELGYVEDFNY